MLKKSLLQHLINNPVDIDSHYENIRENLECILNSRIKYTDSINKFPALDNSLIYYGLKDFMSFSFSEKKTKLQLCNEIAHAIKKFESRLANIIVELLDEDDTTSRILKIRIEGCINALEKKIPAVFESNIDLNKTIISFQ